MRILIVGAGLYGGLLGAALIEGGADVTFLVRPGRQHQLVSKLYISSPFGRFSKAVHAITALAEGQPFDVVILATRANVFQVGLFLADNAIGPNTIIVPAFDGAHHLNHWRDNYPNNPVGLPVFDIRASFDADGCIRQNGPRGDLRLGSILSSDNEQLKPLAASLDGRHFTAQLAPDKIVAEVWAKHCFSAAAIATARLDGMTLKDSLRFGRRDLFGQILKEALAVGEAHDVKGLRFFVERYRTKFQMESAPIAIPTPIAVGGRAGDEAFSILGTLLAQAQHAKVRVPGLQNAWDLKS
jgi:2-dehydropantoate 2-reductase